MKILIADDDITSRLTLRACLAQWGFEVIEADNGDEAWDHLSRPQTAPLAVLDWLMPGLSGPEVCRRVRAADGKGLPYLILLTGKSARQDVIAGLDAGADDFIAKPFDPEELRARIGAGRRLVEMQLELNTLNQQLEQRVEARTTQVERLLKYQRSLLLKLGHDLKTPLTPLLSLLPLLESPQMDGERQQMLQLAMDSARSIHATVTRVLELCQVEEPRLKMAVVETGLQDLVQDVLTSECCGFAPNGRMVRNEVPSALLARVDVSRVRQVLCHLLHNAIKFTHPDGCITIRGEAQGEAVVIAVADDGVGLESEQLAQVFEPFYKADASRHDLSATGLGLSIARAIIERHGGRMWAESAGPRRGTTIRFTLPAANPSKDFLP